MQSSAAAPTPKPAPAPKPSVAVVARVAKLQGDVSADGLDALSVGTLLPAGSWLRTGNDASLSLDLVNGARVTLEAQSLVLLGPECAASVVLVRGSLQAGLPGQGDPNRAPLRLVTADASLQAERGVEMWLSSAGLATSYVAVLSGALQVERVLPGFTQRELAAGQALALAGDEPSRVPANALAGLRKQAAARRSPPPPASSLQARGEGLAAELSALRQELAVVRSTASSTRAEQSAAHATGDVARVRQLQAELVARAQRVVELRRQLLTVYESQLVLASSTSEPPEATQRVLQLASDYVQALPAAKLR